MNQKFNDNILWADDAAITFSDDLPNQIYQKNKAVDELDKKDTLNCNSDDDDSGISRNCKINGFTVDGYNLVPWDKTKHQNSHFVKYITHPYLLSTSGDPYKDKDKIFGEVDNNTLQEARHPLVAACPEIIITLEKIVISKNTTEGAEIGKTKTEDKTKTITSGTTNSNTHGQGTNTSRTWTLDGLKVSTTLSSSYSHESTTVVTIDEAKTYVTSETTGESWTKTLNLEMAKSAFLNMNIRYKNIGTTPIYNFQPTLNFVIGDDKDAETVATITAQSNSIANVVLPNQTYPEQGQHPLAFHASDDFNWQSIMLNYNQVERLNKGDKLQVQMTQFLGNYGIKDSDTQSLIIDQDSNSWHQIFSNIYGQTACITINLLHNQIYRRRIAVRKLPNYWQQTLQELTLQEAIEISFPYIIINRDNKTIAHKNDQQYLFEINIDEITHQQIITQKIKNIFDLKLTQGMNIWITQVAKKFNKDEKDKQDENKDNETKNILDEKLITDLFSKVIYLVEYTHENPLPIPVYHFHGNFDHLVPDIKNWLQSHFKEEIVSYISRLIITNHPYNDHQSSKSDEINIKNANFWLDEKSIFEKQIIINFFNYQPFTSSIHFSLNDYHYQLVTMLKDKFEEFKKDIPLDIWEEQLTSIINNHEDYNNLLENIFDSNSEEYNVAQENGWDFKKFNWWK